MPDHAPEYLVALRHPGGDIYRAGIVDSMDEGELWCCRNMPDDGTQLDYLRFELHPAINPEAVPDLLGAAIQVTNPLRHVGGHPIPWDMDDLRAAITKARKE